MHNTQLKFITRLLILVALMIAIAGCSSKSNEQAKDSGDKTKEAVNSDDGTPKKGGEATFAYGTEIGNFDPIKGTAGDDHAFLWPVYDTLITFNTELEPQPGLAETWEFPDDKTIVLKLREGVTFHDGTPFNAEAVKFNIERVNSEESNVSDLENIESVEIVNENTVKLNLSEPDSSLVLALTDRGGMMVSPTAVKESEEDLSQQPVGAGPYKMVNRIPNGEVVYEAYEEYWQEDKPYLDKMIIKIMVDEITRINALRSGEVDYADNLSLENVANLEKDPKIVLKDKMTVRTRYLGFNASKAPVDNKAVRQAISHGIDREALNKSINFGNGEPASQLFPKDYWAADKELNIDYDPEKAKKLLQEAGLENVSIRILHYTPAYDTRLAEAIKSQLNEVGIQVDLQVMEQQAANAKFLSDKAEPALLGRWTGRPDPLMTMKSLFKRDSFYNVGSYSTDAIEKLITEAASSNDQDELAKLYREISKKAILEEAIVIPLFLTPMVSAMNESIKGFDPNMLGKPLFSTVWKEQ